MSETVFHSKFHRERPTREFDPHQSLYTLTFEQNAGNMDLNYAQFYGMKKTYTQLKATVDQLAAAITKAGVKPGDTVAVSMLNSPEITEILLAVNKVGAISFWMNADTTPEDMEHYEEECKFTLAIVIEPLMGIFQTMTSLLKVVVPVAHFLGQPVTAPIDPAQNYIAYADFLKTGEGMVTECYPYQEDATAIIVQSSGSTGKAKALLHTAYNLNSQVQKLSYLDLPFFVGTKNMALSPPWIIYGLVTSMYCALIFGMETTYEPGVGQEMTTKHLGEYNVCFGYPAGYRYLYGKMCELEKAGTPEAAAELADLKEKLKMVEVFICGGDKLPEEEHTRWQTKFNVPVVNGYGNNEVVGAAICCPQFANRPGSVGIPLYGTLVKTYDAETDTILPEGGVGEVLISSDSIFIKYLADAEETARIKQEHDGLYWVHTGDLGYVDKDGYVYLLGRTKRLIIDRMGFKLSPENSENYIMKQPHVRECVVVGVEVAELSSVPMAFIELDCPDEDGKILEKVIKAAKRGIKEYEQPRIYKLIDKMPHMKSGGKRDFRTLEKLAAEYVAEQKAKGEKFDF